MKYNTEHFENLFSEPSRNGLTKPKRVRGEGVKFLNMGELFAYDRIYNIEMDRAPITDKERENALLKEKDLLFARQSLVLDGVGKCSILKEIKEDTTFDSHLIRVRLNEKKAYPEFYYYYFMSPQGKWHIQSMASQVAAAGIKGSDLRKMDVPYPSLPTQRKIAAILSSLDDKIENNRKTCEKLEEIAQAIFKRWFVDFEFPNEEGKPYKSSGGKMAESELGLIPEGWRVNLLDDLCDIKGGKRLPKGETLINKKTEHPYIRVRDIDNDMILNHCRKFQYISDETFSKISNYIVDENDVIISIVGSIGFTSIIDKTLSKASLTENCAKFTNIKFINAIYLYLYLTSSVGKDEINSGIVGAVQKKLPLKNIREFRIVVPEDKVLRSKMFENLKYLSDKYGVIKNEIEVLQQTRDALLPKLMSGEMDVN